MTLPTIGILGATGAVGQQMLRCLEEQNISFQSLHLFASAASVGKTYTCYGRPYTVESSCADNFKGIDYLLCAVDDVQAQELIPQAAARGIVCIDNSHAFRMNPNVPLVIPEINMDDIRPEHTIIANPNCATIIALVPLFALHQAAGLIRLIVSTYQAASGAGVMGQKTLEEEISAISSHSLSAYNLADTQYSMTTQSPFAHQLACNLIPLIGSTDNQGYSSEELKMLHEGRKILHAPELRVSCTCVRVPVMRSHAESITCEFKNSITLEQARQILTHAPGVIYIDDPAQQNYPMPLQTTDQDMIYVGRLREDISAKTRHHSLSFWCCGDQIRKGAATNAVQILKHLLER